MKNIEREERITLTIGSEFKKEVKGVAKREFLTMSQLIRRCLRSYIDRYSLKEMESNDEKSR